MTGAFGQALAFIVLTIVQLFTYAVILRFMLQAVRANFYNPITQAVVKITNPVLQPLRRIVPGLLGLDMAGLVLALLLCFCYLVLAVNSMGQVVVFSTGFPDGLVSLTMLVTLAPFELLDLIMGLYFVALLVMVIVSWVAPTTAHPGALLVYELCEPVLRPVRRLIPPLGGLDLSVLVVFLLFSVLDNILLPAVVQELFGRAF